MELRLDGKVALVTGADIANAVVFLVSDAASWIAGHTLVVDGGALVATR